ncbi:E3 binding domain-containing protein (plasmid) [Streptomyces sp. BI20]|uniref:E3 binding domain-containing protein n=1 Tax=Streptomyces sp. BI20 TaxID=3403460 RepID=UPI003C76D099
MTGAGRSTESERARDEWPVSVGTGEAEVFEDDPRVNPLIRRMADRRGVDLARVRGSGVGGRVRRTDLPGGGAGRAACSRP